ncbi:MAG: NAD-dependent epimerase/dehydratase family protein [Thermoplasmata archaeon]
MTGQNTEGPVVVTGGAGAIGSWLVRSLVERGATVRVLDNLSTGRRELLPSSPQVSLTTADLSRPGSWTDHFEGASTVWHLAANPDIRLGTADPRVDVENGTLATFHVLEAARLHDVGSVTYSSSSVVYGQAKVLPTPEEYGPLLPESMYAAGKLAAEGLVSAYAHSYGIRGHIYRFANIIGPGMGHGILPDFFAKLRADPSRLEVLGDGRQAKSYLRTEDCVGAMLLGREKAHETVNVFNLGNADRITVREIAEKVVAAHGGRARIEYTGGSRGWVGDVPQQLLAIDRMQRLGWSPRYNSAGAIDRTIEELQAVGTRMGSPTTDR